MAFGAGRGGGRHLLKPFGADDCVDEADVAQRPVRRGPTQPRELFVGGLLRRSGCKVQGPVRRDAVAGRPPVLSTTAAQVRLSDGRPPASAVEYLQVASSSGRADALVTWARPAPNTDKWLRRSKHD